MSAPEQYCLIDRALLLVGIVVVMVGTALSDHVAAGREIFLDRIVGIRNTGITVACWHTTG